MAVESLEVIQNCPLLMGLDETEAKQLATAFHEQSFGEGATVFLEQFPGESLFVIVEGTVRISRMMAEGDEQVLGILGPEEMFGEFAIIDGGPRLVTARAADQLKLYRLGRAYFEKICQVKPSLGLKLLRNITRVFAGKMRDSQDEYRQMLLWTLGRRK